MCRPPQQRAAEASVASLTAQRHPHTSELSSDVNSIDRKTTRDRNALDGYEELGSKTPVMAQALSPEHQYLFLP